MEGSETGPSRMPIRAEVGNETRESFRGEDMGEVVLAWDQLAVAVGKPGLQVVQPFEIDRALGVRTPQEQRGNVDRSSWVSPSSTGVQLPG